MQDQNSLQLENSSERFFKRIFKNKIKGKDYAFRIIVLIMFSYALSFFFTTYVNFYLNSMATSNDPFNSSLTLFAQLLTTFTYVSFLITVILVIRRVNDIVYDVVTWPYALCAVILSCIPFLGYVVLIALAILPSDYLNQEKQNQLFKKFA